MLPALDSPGKTTSTSGPGSWTRITEEMSVSYLSILVYSSSNLILCSGVVMFNHAETAFTVKKGDRIAQLVCERIHYPEVEVLETLNETDRGEAGFGSTGTN